MAKIKSNLKKILLSVPFLNTKIRNHDYVVEKFNQCGFEPGHFYSPIPDINEVRKNSNKIFTLKIPQGVDLNTENQVRLLSELKQYYSSYPYHKMVVKPRLRYRKEESYYRFS